MVMTAERRDPSSNPLEILEELVSANDWLFDRRSESEMLVEIAGRWCRYQLSFLWDDELSAIQFACYFDARVPTSRRTAVHELLAEVNEKLWLGHFDLNSEDGEMFFRHTMPFRGVASASIEQLEDLLDAGIIECERFYPALQLVLWGGESVELAMAAALMETVGEA